MSQKYIQLFKVKKIGWQFCLELVGKLCGKLNDEVMSDDRKLM